MGFRVTIKNPPSGPLRGMAISISKALPEDVFKGAVIASGELARKVLQLFKPGTSTLARSFLPAFIDKSKTTPSAGALSDVIYAGKQDVGGKIRPRNARMLAIPVHPRAKKRNPRDFGAKELVLIRSKKGNLLLVKAKQKKLEVFYILRKEVEIKGKKYVSKATQEARPKIQKVVEKSIKTSIDANAKGKRNG